MKRKTFLINPSFQFWFITWMLSIAFIVILFFKIASVVVFKSFLDWGVALHLPQGHAFFSFVKVQQEHINWVFLGTTFLALVFVSGIGLFLSHRIAGPLFRLQQHMERNFPKSHSRKFVVRSQDQFRELAETYNRVLATPKKER